LFVTSQPARAQQRKNQAVALPRQRLTLTKRKTSIRAENVKTQAKGRWDWTRLLAQSRAPTHFQKPFSILFQYLFNTKLKIFNTIIYIISFQKFYSLNTSQKPCRTGVIAGEEQNLNKQMVEFRISAHFQYFMCISAKFNTFSSPWKPISQFNTFPIPRGNPANHSCGSKRTRAERFTSKDSRAPGASAASSVTGVWRVPRPSLDTVREDANVTKQRLLPGQCSRSTNATQRNRTLHELDGETSSVHVTMCSATTQMRHSIWACCLMSSEIRQKKKYFRCLCSAHARRKGFSRWVIMDFSGGGQTDYFQGGGGGSGE